MVQWHSYTTIYGWHWAVFKFSLIMFYISLSTMCICILVSHDQLTILFSSVWSSSVCSASMQGNI